MCYLINTHTHTIAVVRDVHRLCLMVLKRYRLIGFEFSFYDYCCTVLNKKNGSLVYY